MKDVARFIKNAPKAELHVHIEGTLEPDMVVALAKRNGIKLKFSTVEQLRAQLVFSDLQAFLDLYYHNTQVLITEEDFYDLMCAYLERAYKDNVRHAEVFFDPQWHARRGISFDTVMHGLIRGVAYGEKLGVSCELIVCFLRDFPIDGAFEALEHAAAYKKHIVAVGLGSAEKGYPPELFVEVFAKARAHGFLAVCHAGEEGPADYIWQALNLLKVSRIDHGNACVDDPALVSFLARERIPLTMCPLSNRRLQVIKSLKDHPAKYLLDQGLCVTINSDDPAYFGGYINDNLLALQQALNLTQADLYALLKNSFEASFLPKKKKNDFIDELATFIQSF